MNRIKLEEEASVYKKQVNSKWMLNEEVLRAKGIWAFISKYG
jgi:hypothetical protein